MRIITTDYCNSLSYGIPDCKRKQLQRMHNTAARVATLIPCSPQHHITELSNYLHWLPVKKRIIFKIFLLIYKCVNNIAPNYLCELLSPTKFSRPLRSDSQYLLQLPVTRCNHMKTGYLLLVLF